VAAGIRRTLTPSARPRGGAAPRSWRVLACALALVLCQLPLSAFAAFEPPPAALVVASCADDACADACCDCCEPPPPRAAEPCCAPGAGDDGEPCCPDGCPTCPRPCCSGPPAVVPCEGDAPPAAPGAPSLEATEGELSSSPASGVFHPPRS